jgi:hypothetical protein
MAGNITPIYSKVGDIQWTNGITAANTAMDGTGTVSTCFTSDATNGGFIQNIVFRPQGTNVASVARIFINNGSTNTTASNNTLFAEVNLPSTTASNTAALTGQSLLLGIALPPGYKINVTLGTAIAAGVSVTVVGGKY